MIKKMKLARQLQYEKDGKNFNPVLETNESLHDIISELREEYLSDLHPEEIPNSDISDISESELTKGQENLDNMEKGQDLDSKIEISKQLTDKYIEKNHQFMSEFVKTYKENSSEAKRNYY
jgi:hypothetical protein